MSHKAAEAARSIVIPVAGAANAGHDLLSTASVHFGFLDGALSVMGHSVTYPIVPSGLGIFHDMEEIYGHFAETVDEKLEQSRDVGKVLLLCHSLGVLLARRYASEQQGGDRHFGVIAIAGPNDGLTRIVPKPWRDRYQRFAYAIEPPNGDGSLQQVFIGSTSDKLVPIGSSLAAVPYTERYQFGFSRHPDPTVHSVFWPRLSHNFLPVSLPVIALTTYLANTMLQESGVPPEQYVCDNLASLPQSA